MFAALAKFFVGAEFLRWLGKFAEDGVTGNPSTKRYGQLSAITVLALCVVWLAYRIGLLNQWEALVWAYGITVVALLVLAGFGYLLGKAIERMNYTPPEVKPPRAVGKDKPGEGGGE